jgi:oxepin-CoA hydrolase / 3-oxo-5,6-dehydrosuberyl-CoA semialdehyde dehydrogenase
MNRLGNYIAGSWIEGEGEGQPLYHAVTGEEVARAGTKGLDLAGMLEYGRKIGNPALRKMTFQERGRMLRSLALYLREKDRLERFYQISFATGATRADSWIDLEGGIGNLFANASLRRKFPNETFCTDGEGIKLGKGGTFMGQHILVPREGVAIHINAFNFPVWGMLEKIAVNLLAGVPAVVKPATLTSFLTESVVREIIASDILPPGALQLICGSAGDLLDHVGSQDIVTFTGSAITGHILRLHPAIQRENTPFTMESDSLNCLVLGEDIDPSMPEWDLFVKELRKEMTIKAGQKCTAVRRIFVPENKMEDAWKALSAALSKTVIGNPEHEKVRMGPLSGRAQREEVKAQVEKLLASSQILYGSLDSTQLNGKLLDANAEKGAFLSPLLLLNQRPFDAEEPHTIEAFGPVATIMPYRGAGEAISLSKKGKGSLCSTIVTANQSIAREYVLGVATHHGRILVLNRECSAESTGHGSPLPLLVHGGPGRAGGGEEMGGVRGVKHYMQRVAVQGSPSVITAITHIYQPQAAQILDEQHPFRKYFEQLQIGDTVITHKRTVTEGDIVNFANLTWDHFYAHTDHTSLEGTLFERPVAHGYFILSLAAGLFVDAAKGPVLLNYGLEECRFLKPVYAGSTLGVKLTCKEKIEQEKREESDIPRGIVKWYVDIYDETGDSVAIATILTMVRRKT